MANITITIADEKVEPIVTAFCNKYNYEGEDTAGAKKAFALGKVKTYIREIYKSDQVKTDTETTRQTTIIDSDNYTNDLTIE